jgi:hypothetical protein
MGGFSFKALKGLARIPTQQEADLNALSGMDTMHPQASHNCWTIACAPSASIQSWIVLQGGASR